MSYLPGSDYETLRQSLAFYGPAIFEGGYHRVFLSSFAHNDLMHLLFNLAFFWVIASDFEREFHRKSQLLVMVLGWIWTSLLLIWVTPLMSSVGLSGILFSLCSASLVLSFSKLKEDFRKGFPRILAAFIFIYLGDPHFYEGYRSAELLEFSISNVSHAGHLGGFLGGFIAAVGIAFFARKPQWILVGVSALLLLTSLYVQSRKPVNRLPLIEVLSRDTSKENESRLDAILQESPNLIPAHALKAFHLFNKDDYQNAAHHLKQIEETAKSNEFISVLAISSYFELKDYVSLVNFPHDALVTPRFRKMCLSLLVISEIIQSKEGEAPKLLSVFKSEFKDSADATKVFRSFLEDEANAEVKEKVLGVLKKVYPDFKI